MKKILLILILFSGLSAMNAVYGQAANWPGYIDRGLINPGNNGYAYGATDIGPGYYERYNACAGVEYYFYGCDWGNWDTDYVLFNNANGALLYHFDGHSGCGTWRANGDANASNRYTSTITGQVRVIMPVFSRTTSSSANSWNWYSGATACTRLGVKAIPPSAPSTPSGATTICVGGSATLSRVGSPPGSGVTWYWQTSTGGTSTGASGSTYTVSPSSTTTYYLRPRSCHGYWGTASGGVTVTVVSDPSVSISGGGTTAGCSGLNPSTLSASISGGTGGSTYQWQLNGSNISGATGSTYDPPALGAGTYQYRVIHNRTGSGCGQAISNTITFTVTADPTASISGGGVTSGCVGLNPSLLTGSVNDASGTDSYQWQLNGSNISGATGTTYDPPALNSPGTYSYRLIHAATGSACNTATSNTITFTITADPTASISGGGSTSGCVGLNPTTLTGSVNDASGTDSYQWQLNGVNIGGATGTSYDPPVLSSPGTYTYRLIHSASGSACGTATSNTITFTVTADPTATISGGGPSSGCENTNFNPTLLSSSVNDASGTDTYQWTLNGSNISGATGTTYDPPALNAPGTYVYRLVHSASGSACGAATSNAITFTIDEEPNITAPASVCDNTTASVSANVGSVSVSAGSLSGTTFTPPNIAPPTANQTVTITAVNGACTVTQNIQVDNRPTITSSGAAMCEGQSRTLTSDVTGTTFSGTGVSGGVFTAPDPGGVSANYFINAANGSCTELQLITVYDAISITSSGADMCVGDTRTFTASGPGGTWYVNGVPTGATWTAPTPSGASQTYTIDYIVPGSPCNPSQSITVYANPSAADAGGDLQGCIGVATTLTATAPAIGTGTWSWSPSAPSYVGGTNANDHDAQVVFSSGGTYTGAWTVANGACSSSSDAMTLEIYSSANNVVLATGTAVAVEVCEETPWTYYATPANPDEYVFAINKNGSTFDAEVTITDVPGTAPIESLGGLPLLRGTWLISRYWDVNVTSGSVTTPVSIRYFVDPAEITDAQNAANAFVGSHPLASTITSLQWFKTPNGQTFNPSTDLINGDFTFTPIYLTPSSTGTINGVFYVEFPGITGFSGGTGGFSVNDDNSPLPVELLSFEANAVDNQYIQLDWATATEVNNEGFEVLRSTDGSNFERIAWVPGNGNSTVVNEYGYNDHDVVKGQTYYYQLRQVDFDGQSELFNIVSAKLSSNDQFVIGNLIPNPSKENGVVRVNVQASIEADEVVTIQVYNHVGAKVAYEVHTLTNGENTLEVNISELASGTYFMNFESSFGIETRKLVVIR